MQENLAKSLIAPCFEKESGRKILGINYYLNKFLLKASRKWLEMQSGAFNFMPCSIWYMKHNLTDHTLLAGCLLSISEYVHTLLFVVLRGAKKNPHATEFISRFTKHFSLQPTYASRFWLLYFEYRKRRIDNGAIECCINCRCLCVVAIRFKNRKKHENC